LLASCLQPKPSTQACLPKMRNKKASPCLCLCLWMCLCVGVSVWLWLWLGVCVCAIRKSTHDY
jgi:hypothetical protein